VRYRFAHPMGPLANARPTEGVSKSVPDPHEKPLTWVVGVAQADSNQSGHKTSRPARIVSIHGM
jgi:hypothetical protein